MGKSKPELRQEYIKTCYLETVRIPPSKELSEKFGVSVRQIDRDIRTVAECIKDPELVDKISRKFLEELRRRLPDMEDRDFVKLTKHFLAEKQEVEAKGDLKFVLQAWRKDADGQD